jgi:hypothetical protein
MKRVIVALLMTLPVVAAAQIRQSSISTETPEQFSRADVEIKLTGSWENPYLSEQAALDVIITTPSGSELVLPCWFETGESGKLSTWKARFTPREVGEYSYLFRYTEDGRVKSNSKSKKFTTTASSAKGFLRAGDMWTLRFDNGDAFRGVGENICWESRARDDSKFFSELHQQHDRFSYDRMIPEFAAAGGNFTRVWMCSWNFPIDQQRNFNNVRYTESDEYFNPSAVARLDYFVDLCEREGVYVMLCMGGGNVRTDLDFFTTTEAKQRYKNRARYIIARWGYSPNIAMWEFFNEIDNIQFRTPQNPIPAEAITEWHAEMARWFKQTDPYRHLLTTSISHRDVEGLNSIPEMDINQKHIYRNTSAIPYEIKSYEKEYGKPYVIGEFGYEWDWSKNFDDFGEDMDNDFRRGLWYGLFSPTPVTPMSWWWEYFDNRGMVPYFRGVRRISDRMLADGGGRFEALGATCGKAETFAVKCGDNIYVYIYNQTAEAVRNNLIIDYRGGRYDIEEFDAEGLTYASQGTLTAPTGIHFTKIDMAPKQGKILIFTPRD